MSIIEGFGDEVLICFVVLIFAAVLTFAWFSTHVPPIWNTGSVWVVQMQTNDATNRRVLQVVSLEQRSADEVVSPENVINADGHTPQYIVEHQQSSNATDVETDSVQTNEEESNVDSADNHSKTEPKREEPVVENRSTAQGEADAASSSTSTIKLKFLDDTHKLVGTWLSQTVGQFKRTHFLSEVNQGKTIRLIYQGQLLRDDARSLESYGVHDNCVLHCHIGTTPYAQPAQPSATEPATNVHQPPRHVRPFDVGQYVNIIFGVKFIILWLGWFMYPQFFSVTSVVSLLLCTSVYALFVYNGRRRPRVNIN